VATILIRLYFLENKLTKLANLVKFLNIWCVLCGWLGRAPWAPLAFISLSFLPFPLFTSPPFYSPFASPIFSSVLSFSSPSPSIRCRTPKIQLWGLGECCELPQCWNRIWCISAVKDEIWWQQLYSFENKLTKLANLVEFLCGWCIHDMYSFLWEIHLRNTAMWGYIVSCTQQKSPRAENRSNAIDLKTQVLKGCFF